MEWINKGPECSRQNHAVNMIYSAMIHQQFRSSIEGSFGQLYASHIILCYEDRRSRCSEFLFY